MIDLSIIIVSFETRELLARCLDAVEAAGRSHPDLRCETIVVDNGSRDGSPASLLERGAEIRCLAFGRNRGFAAAVNAGLRIRRGRHVVLLNSDALIDPDCLALGCELLDRRSEVAVAGVALAHLDGRRQRSVHAFPGLATEWLPEPVLRPFRPGGFELSSRDPTGPRAVEAVRGAVFFMQGGLIDELGAFDEGCFFFLEETDYCWRARQAGYEVVVDGAMRAKHVLGASSKRRAPLETRIEFHRSLYRFLARRRGRAVAALARGIRVLRNLLALGGSLPLGLASLRWREHNAERWGLILWHLHGCPPEAGLSGTGWHGRERGRGV